MAIRTKLTYRDDDNRAGSSSSHGSGGGKTPRSEEEKAKRKERVEAAKDALKRSASLKGEHVPPARAALKQYLQRLNESRQPDDEQFAALLEGPFRVPPKKRERR